jgi:hypothetical protein
MSQRMNILGKGQGLDGDLTSTGATCLATQARGTTYGRRWLLEGDKTTPAHGAARRARSSTANHAGARMVSPPQSTAPLWNVDVRQAAIMSSHP